MHCTSQAPLSMRLSRQEDWSGLPFPMLGDLLNLGVEPASLASSALADRFFTTAPQVASGHHMGPHRSREQSMSDLAER